MMKLVYYPSFFGLRRLGNRRAIVIATATVFVTTWLLHSYQWFWLRGGFPITLPDTLFWGTLGVFVVVTSLRESERGRRRVIDKPRWRARLGLRTVAMFCVLAVLWSLWSAESVMEWLWMWRAAGVATGREMATIAALLICAVAVTGWPWGAQTLRKEERPPLYRQPTVRAIATLLVLLILVQSFVQAAVPASTRDLVASLQNPGLSSVDAAFRVRGYYEQLDQRGAVNGQALWEEVAQKPANWVELSKANLIVERPDFLITTLAPSYRFVWNGHETSTNRWGMRDRDYTLAKPAGTYRIAVLGPSLTMGNGVHDAEVFDNILEDRLAREPITNRYQKIEVLNFGTSGYALPQQLVQLEDRVLRFHPDLVILTESPYFRDGIRRFLERVLGEERPIPYPALRTVLAKAGLFPFDNTGVPMPFATVRRLADAFGVHGRMTSGEARARIYSVSPDVARWATERMASDIRAAGAVPALLALTAVEPLPKDAGEWVRIGRDAGLVTFDLLHLYAGRDLATIRVAPWDNHPNATGHRLIADDLYRQLREHAGALGLASDVALAARP
jgi:hypothetical protein